MDRPLRVALIGCGWASTRHAAAFTRCGADLRWAVDTYKARGRSQHRPLASVLAAYESMETGKPVKIEEREG